ncbi:MAG: MCE family protein [Candidatus Cloacimonetes bacterium]|nr:MCE family protein [Candidatus Cloacimonadota bacterium]
MRNIQIRTGIWTVFIALVMIFGYLWMSNKITTKSQRDLQISFDDVQGLEVGDKVMYRGMEAGRVKKLQTKSDQILVTVRVLSGIELLEGSRFQVWDSSLMGGKVLLIVPGEGPGKLNTAITQFGEAPEGMMDLISRASTTLAELQITMESMKSPGGLNDKVNSLVNNADQTVVSAKKLTDSIERDLGRTIERIDLLVTEVNSVVKENRSPLQLTLKEAPGLLSNINGTLDSLRVLSGSLAQSTEALNNGEGTAAKLLQDDELYVRMLKSLENLEILVQDIKANPKKYVKFSLF